MESFLQNIFHKECDPLIPDAVIRELSMFLVVLVLFPPPGIHVLCKSHRSEVLSNIREGSPHPRGAVLIRGK